MYNGLNSLIPPKKNAGDSSKPHQGGNFGAANLPAVNKADNFKNDNLGNAGAFVKTGQFKSDDFAIPENQNPALIAPIVPAAQISNEPKDAFIIHQEQPIKQQSQSTESLPETRENQTDDFKEETTNPFQQRHHRRPVIGDAIFNIEVEKIKPNPFQPRKHFDEQALKDLANSIREHGILQPLVVSKIESDIDTGTMVEYQLIAGERRLKAAKLSGLERVPVIIRQMGEKAEHLEVAIIENLQRENLDSVETARAYARLQDEFGMTQREIAVRLGKSREVVANALRLLSLPTEFQNALSKSQINESQARLLLAVENPIVQKQLFNDVISNNLTVREVRNRVKKIHLGGHLDISPVGHDSSQDIEIKGLENKLKEVLGAEVKIEKKGDSGKIVISFYSPEEIYGIIHKINPYTNDNY